MSKIFLLMQEQLMRIQPYFLPSHGVARVNDRKVIRGSCM